MKLTRLFLFLKNKKSVGYTLTELLVAASLTSVLVSGAGYGLFSATKSKNEGSYEVERRTEINRALDFIATEIKLSKTIDTETASSGFDISLDDTQGEKVILALELPDNRKIIYYTKNSITGSPWIGPKLVYRWGPPIDDNGQYTSGSSESKLLIDRVGSTINNSCLSGETSVNAPGFASCINSTGKSAKVFIAGVIGDTFTSGTKADKVYEANSRVFARNDVDNYQLAYSNPNLNSNVTNTNNGGNNGDDDGNPPDCNISNGLLSCTGDANLNFKVIGHNYACDSATMWDVSTQISVQSSDGNWSSPSTITLNSPLKMAYTLGQKIKVGAQPIQPGGATCLNTGALIDSTDTVQAKALFDEETVPNYQPFNNQTSIPQFLQEYTNNNGTEVNIGSNQIIYLFEIGQRDQTAKGFDFQDNVVLVTVGAPTGNSNSNGN
jgi:type II secretory pathway pseudopilin PulG